MKEAHEENLNSKSASGNSASGNSADNVSLSKNKEKKESPKDPGLEADPNKVAGEAQKAAVDPVSKLFKLDEVGKVFAVSKGMETFGRLRNDLLNGLVKREVASELVSSISLDLSKKYMQGRLLAEQLEKGGQPAKPLSRDEHAALAVYRKIKDELPAKFPFYDAAVLKKDLDAGIALKLNKSKSELPKNAFSKPDSTKDSGESRVKSNTKNDVSANSSTKSRPETETKAGSKSNSLPHAATEPKAQTDKSNQKERTLAALDGSAPGYLSAESPKIKVEKANPTSQSKSTIDRAEEPLRREHLLGQEADTEAGKTKEIVQKSQLNALTSHISKDNLDEKLQNLHQDKERRQEPENHRKQDSVKKHDREHDREYIERKALDHNILEPKRPAIKEESNLKAVGLNRSENQDVLSLSQKEESIFVGLDIFLHKIARSSLANLVFHRSAEITLDRIGEVLSIPIFLAISQKRPLSITNAPDRSVKTLILFPVNLPIVDIAAKPASAKALETAKKVRDRVLSLPFTEQWQQESGLICNTAYRTTAKISTVIDKLSHLENTKTHSQMEGPRSDRDVKAAVSNPASISGSNSINISGSTSGKTSEKGSDVGLDENSEKQPNLGVEAAYAGRQSNDLEAEHPDKIDWPEPAPDGGDELSAPGSEMVFAAIIALAAVARTRQENLTSFGEDHAIGVGGQVLHRPKLLIAKDDTLASIAERLFHDRSLAHLIADLNTKVSDQFILSGNRIIRLKVRQEIQLPVYTDIVTFKKERANSALYSAPLVTIVEDTEISKEALREAFSPFVKSLL
ncbi:MAG: hypothetical protein J0M35_04055 [Candidatus Obscuribacter phosphatis]|uniref:Uncharacterized protein n=1 Tax=Candidatus Obscuribacter phosphatis TaxID=1906157 RepID=A0A8J7TL14_9BACT|nr:hypothetical protein [Candidatus Obscuribacter phosphatis]